MEITDGGGRWLYCRSEPLGVTVLACQVSGYSKVPSPLFCRAKVGSQNLWDKNIHHPITALMIIIGCRHISLSLEAIKCRHWSFSRYEFGWCMQPPGKPWPKRTSWKMQIYFFWFVHDPAFQRDLDRLERWACMNLMKFEKDKYKVPHVSWGNPKHK